MFSKQFEIKPVWLKKSSMTGPPLSNTFFLSFDTILIQGDFFNWPSPENVSRLAPPKFAWTGPPPNFSKCWNHIHFARHLGVFRSEGGPVWDSNVFLKSVTYRPTLSKFRGGPVKKNTLYLIPSTKVNSFNLPQGRQ